jgi:hypothetical protein
MYCIVFCHEQCPSNSVDPWCLIKKIQLMKVLVSLLVFIELCNTPSRVKICVMEPNVFLGYLKRGIACLVNPFRHEQYLYNSLEQNNLAHGVTM